MVNQRQIDAHLTRTPAVLGGKPIIRGTRINVSLVIDWLHAGVLKELILEDHPNLTQDDVEAARAYSQQSRPAPHVYR
jgi:uncharacterized protein (DUF433 family)